ncbi:MAG: acetyl-CoA carboxylase biotin carboxylase subunit [candidate division KSB1 bacterium]|nr:acetyl-CoA carboxylase biotin carboxylase subunit [candidate division KSB1 bacterium]
MFKKILIANRGEIAIRIMRTCRELGIATVAVYSEVDRTAQHVRYADEAYLLGPAPATESYLVMEKIIEAAKKSQAQAIHPGYGFLAENPEFASLVNDSGLIFIGPEPETIRLLGDKMAARAAMIRAGVPIVPGMKQAITSVAEAQKIAEEIGYPILLKAAAGGGGKGMRIVHRPDEMAQLFKMASSEAKSAFGDDRIYIEKYLEKPRHVEIQIIADQHGHVVHLGERECSIQRRHQKVIEESPSPIVDPEMRQRMGETAVKAARAANYTNAGTVEFLVDQNKNFYFLEVNTRLQVEHPVTEMVTGIDLAKEQIRIAAGEPLSFSQQDVQWRGAAIECRIYAEDSENNFLPSIGKIQSYREPQGIGVRVDSGLAKGDSVSMYYDPLISKLITWGRDRHEAIQRMKRALDEYVISGVQTVIPFHKQVMIHPDFVTGNLSTHFIDENKNLLCDLNDVSEADLEAMAILSCLIDYQSKKRVNRIASAPNLSIWKYETRRRRLFGV